MTLCFYRGDLYGSYLEACKQGAMREISGLQTEYRTLYEAGGDLADTLEAIHKTARMMDGNATIRYVLFDDSGGFLDAC
jgi:hypothetical protein